MQLIKRHPWAALALLVCVMGASVSVPVPLPTAVDVRKFGAKGDGVTDDTAAFNSALGTANRRIFVSEGTYIVAKLLFPADGVTLEGQGYGSCLKLKAGLGTGNPVLYINKGGAKYRTGVTIRNLRVDGNAAGGYTNASSEVEGINADNTEDLTIDNVWVENCGPDAIDCDGENVGLRITNCRIRDCGNGGMHLYGVKNGVISGNHIENSGRNWTTANPSAAPSAIDIISEQQDGVEIGPAENVVITGNTIKDCNHGINVGLADKVVVAKNIIENMDANGQVVAAYGAGIGINPTATNCIVANNVIHTTYNDGIYGVSVLTKGNVIYDAGRATGNATARRGISAAISDVLIEGNYVYNTLGCGILTSTNATIRGNVVDTTTTEGIFTNTAAGASIEDNKVYDAGTIGISATWRADIVGNKVDGATTNGIKVDTTNANGSTIRGNTVRNTTQSGIVWLAGSVQCVGNYVTGVGAGTFFGIQANGANASNAQIVGNYCTGNPYGIAISASTTGWFVSGNKCHTNSSADMLISGTAGAGRLEHDNDFGTISGSYLFGSATFNPASLADAAGETTTVTATGAALGDLAEASFSLDLQGVSVTAWVSSANTVSVRFQNESGGLLDLASGTLRVKVRKQ